jgi:hypothetical protein
MMGRAVPAARISRTEDFLRAYFHPITTPVQDDVINASAVAAKNILIGSGLGATGVEGA